MASDTQLFLNPEQVVGNVVPTIYIDRITLEGGGSIVKETNPHIDWEGEGTGLTFAGSPASNSQEARFGISEVERANVGTKKQDNLSVTLNLTVKDVATNRSYSWFDEIGIDIKQFIKVYVVQTTNPSATRRWSQFFDYNTLPKVDADDDQVAFKGTSIFKFGLDELLGTQRPENQDNAPDTPIHYVEVDSNGTSILNITKIIRFPGDKWEGGRQKLNKNPSHLAYFVYGEFSMVDLMQKFDTTFEEALGVVKDPTSPVDLFGKVSSDIVIDGGKTVTSAYIYLTQKDELWLGSVSYSEGVDGEERWYGGKKLIPSLGENPILPFSNPLLKRQLVQNNKVQDFRLTEKIEKLNLDFSILENKLLKQITGKERVNTDIVKRKVSFFTELLLSRNKKGECEFFFGIDFQKIIRENSPYGKMYVENEDMHEVLKKSKILSMNIYRVRVGGSSAAGSDPYRPSLAPNFDPLIQPKQFNYDGITRKGVNYTRLIPTPLNPNSAVDMKVFDQTDEIILTARETSSGELEFYAYDGVSKIRALPQVYTKGIQRLKSSPNPNSKLRAYSEEWWRQNGIWEKAKSPVEYFSGTDAAMKDLTDGYYQYRVEIEIQDDTASFLIKKREDLSKAKGLLLKYFEEASKLGNTSLSRTSPKRGQMGEDTFSDSGNGTEANFDPVANKFTTKFQKKMIATYNLKSDGAPWNRFPNTYLNILGIFVDLEDKKDLKEMLTNYINPMSGNLKGISVLLDLMDQLISVLSRGIGITSSKNFVSKTSETSQNNETKTDVAGGIIKKFKIERRFDAIFDASISKNYGVNYINNVEEHIGLPQISEKDWKARITREITRYFSNPLAPIRLAGHDFTANQGAMGYLSPEVINTENAGTVDLVSDSPISDNTYVQIGADVVCASLGQTGISSQPAAGNNASQEIGGDISTATRISNIFANIFSVVPATTEGVEISTIFPPGEIPLNIDDGCGLSAEFADAETVAKLEKEQLALNIAVLPVFSQLLASVIQPSLTTSEGLPSNRPPPNLSDYNFNNPAGLFANFSLSMMDIQNLPTPILCLAAAANQSQGASALPDTSQTLNLTMNSDLQSGLLADPTRQFKANILFKNIVQVEVMVGYRTVKFGKKDGQDKEIFERSVKLPVWEKCSEDMLNGSQNQFLLCRFTNWQDISLGANSSSPTMPLYNQYFLIRNGNPSITQSITSRNIPEDFNPNRLTGGTNLSRRDNNPPYQSWNPYLGGNQ